MQLLVSVRSAVEAGAALLGAADIIDAKEPAHGPLGAVDPATLGEILNAVPSTHPVSVALGDFTTAKQVYAAVSSLAACRQPAFIKLGFAGARTAEVVADLVVTAREAASRTAEPPAVIAVAYADADRVDAPDPWDLCEVARRSGAAGILLDTACKEGRGVLDLMAGNELSDWISLVHLHELTAAIAGRVCSDDLETVVLAGADIIGVRGAACDGGRHGRVSTERVAALAAALRGSTSDIDGGWDEVDPLVLRRS